MLFTPKTLPKAKIIIASLHHIILLIIWHNFYKNTNFPFGKCFCQNNKIVVSPLAAPNRIICLYQLMTYDWWLMTDDWWLMTDDWWLSEDCIFCMLIIVKDIILRLFNKMKPHQNKLIKHNIFACFQVLRIFYILEIFCA